MSSTLLAVDDSVTMRKVLEMTFAGTDLKVLTADGPDAALKRLAADKPDVVLCDITLEPKNGYDLCSAIKQSAPGVRVLLLSSKHHPYDPAKGSGAGVDDHMDKPYDTQQMIDKVRKLLEAPAQAAAAAPAAAAAAPAPHRAPTQPSMQAVAGPPAGGPPQPPPRAKTLMFGQGAAAAAVPAFLQQKAPAAGSSPAAAPAAAAPAAAPAVVARPSTHTTQVSPSIATPAAAAHPPAAAVALPPQMASKLEELGLTPAQVDAVLALSREVVERVVWEVVPVLAETIIKEEISRLTK